MGHGGFSIHISPIIVLMLFCFTAFFAKLGGRGLASYDDLYYAEKAREMVVLNDYLTPHYNYEPKLDTAPMYYWLAAGAYHIFGVSEYAAALPSAILATLTVLLLFVWTRRRFNVQTAFAAALVLATIPHFLKYSRHAMLDVGLTFYTTLSLVCFYEALQGRRWLYLLAGLGAAFGILTKSVLGLFPLIIAFLFLIATRRWREFKSPFLWAGLFVAFGLGLSWYVVQYHINEDLFMFDHIYNIVVARSEVPLEFGFMHRFKYFLLPLQYIPHWSAFMFLGLALSVRMAWKKNELHLLMVLWFAVITLLLTAAANTKTWYMMPAFPALALMAGVAIDFLIQRYARQPQEFFRKSVMVVAALVVGFNLVVTMTPLQLSSQRETDQREFSPYANQLGREGFKMISYRADYHSLNSAMLFYSDYAFLPVIHSAERFHFLLADSKKPVAAMIPKPFWAEVQRPEYVVLKEGNNYVLIANRPVDFSKVLHLKSRWMKN